MIDAFVLGVAGAVVYGWKRWRNSEPVAVAYPLPDVFSEVIEINSIVSERPILTYFAPEEFGDWWPFMSVELLEKLDEFRRRWGSPVVISSAVGALGRHYGGESQHNVDKWGEVRAIDVFPMKSDGGYLETEADRRRAFELAESVGFSGIGLYTDTMPGNMMHLDVRGGRLATWSRVAGKYLKIGVVV